ncbi:MAG: TfoX/Sxy family protein [Clostridiales bacterium]|nr:TfoX/Sxy family protein [Clostridiales bacterium]
MASNLELVEYVCDQLSGAGEITYRKMFGEYGLYCNGKLIGSVCDDQFFVKKTAAGLAVCPDLKEAPPYEGAKPQFVVDSVDDKELMTRFILATYEELPAPKPKKSRQKK